MSVGRFPKDLACRRYWNGSRQSPALRYTFHTAFSPGHHPAQTGRHRIRGDLLFSSSVQFGWFADSEVTLDIHRLVKELDDLDALIAVACQKRESALRSVSGVRAEPVYRKRLKLTILDTAVGKFRTSAARLNFHRKLRTTSNQWRSCPLLSGRHRNTFVQWDAIQTLMA
jgi:hypothetical protein